MASVDFLNECARMGFIDVDGNNNAVNITVIDGLTQALDVHVTREIYDYLKKKEIMCAVVENYEDRSMLSRPCQRKARHRGWGRPYRIVYRLGTGRFDSHKG
jgi:hypothetical protein